MKESRRDQEEGGGAGLSQRSGQSFVAVVPLQWLLGHCLSDVAPHNLSKQQLAKYAS